VQYFWNQLLTFQRIESYNQLTTSVLCFKKCVADTKTTFNQLNQNLSLNYF